MSHVASVCEAGQDLEVAFEHDFSQFMTDIRAARALQNGPVEILHSLLIVSLHQRAEKLPELGRLEMGHPRASATSP